MSFAAGAPAPLHPGAAAGLSQARRNAFVTYGTTVASVLEAAEIRARREFLEHRVPAFATVPEEEWHRYIRILPDDTCPVGYSVCSEEDAARMGLTCPTWTLSPDHPLLLTASGHLCVPQEANALYTQLRQDPTAVGHYMRQYAQEVRAEEVPAGGMWSEEAQEPLARHAAAQRRGFLQAVEWRMQEKEKEVALRGTAAFDASRKRNRLRIDAVLVRGATWDDADAMDKELCALRSTLLPDAPIFANLVEVTGAAASTAPLPQGPQGPLRRSGPWVWAPPPPQDGVHWKVNIPLFAGAQRPSSGGGSGEELAWRVQVAVPLPSLWPEHQEGAALGDAFWHAPELTQGPVQEGGGSDAADEVQRVAGRIWFGVGPRWLRQLPATLQAAVKLAQQDERAVSRRALASLWADLMMAAWPSQPRRNHPPLPPDLRPEQVAHLMLLFLLLLSLLPLPWSPWPAWREQREAWRMAKAALQQGESGDSFARKLTLFLRDKIKHLLDAMWPQELEEGTGGTGGGQQQPVPVVNLLDIGLGSVLDATWRGRIGSLPGVPTTEPFTAVLHEDDVANARRRQRMQSLGGLAAQEDANREEEAADDARDAHLLTGKAWVLHLERTWWRAMTRVPLSFECGKRTGMLLAQLLPRTDDSTPTALVSIDAEDDEEDSADNSSSDDGSSSSSLTGGSVADSQSGTGTGIVVAGGAGRKGKSSASSFAAASLRLATAAALRTVSAVVRLAWDLEPFGIGLAHEVMPLVLRAQAVARLAGMDAAELHVLGWPVAGDRDSHTRQCHWEAAWRALAAHCTPLPKLSTFSSVPQRPWPAPAMAAFAQHVGPAAFQRILLALVLLNLQHDLPRALGLAKQSGGPTLEASSPVVRSVHAAFAVDDAEAVEIDGQEEDRAAAGMAALMTDTLPVPKDWFKKYGVCSSFSIAGKPILGAGAALLLLHASSRLERAWQPHLRDAAVLLQQACLDKLQTLVARPALGYDSEPWRSGDVQTAALAATVHDAVAVLAEKPIGPNGTPPLLPWFLLQAKTPRQALQAALRDANGTEAIPAPLLHALQQLHAAIGDASKGAGKDGSGESGQPGHAAGRHHAMPLLPGVPLEEALRTQEEESMLLRQLAAIVAALAAHAREAKASGANNGRVKHEHPASWFALRLATMDAVVAGQYNTMLMRTPKKAWSVTGKALAATLVQALLEKAPKGNPTIQWDSSQFSEEMQRVAADHWRWLVFRWALASHAEAGAQTPDGSGSDPGSNSTEKASSSADAAAVGIDSTMAMMLTDGVEMRRVDALERATFWCRLAARCRDADGEDASSTTSWEGTSATTSTSTASSTGDPESFPPGAAIALLAIDDAMRYRQAWRQGPHAQESMDPWEAVLLVLRKAQDESAAIEVDWLAWTRGLMDALLLADNGTGPAERRTWCEALGVEESENQEDDASLGHELVTDALQEMRSGAIASAPQWQRLLWGMPPDASSGDVTPTALAQDARHWRNAQQLRQHLAIVTKARELAAAEGSLDSDEGLFSAACWSEVAAVLPHAKWWQLQPPSSDSSGSLAALPPRFDECKSWQRWLAHTVRVWYTTVAVTAVAFLRNAMLHVVASAQDAETPSPRAWGISEQAWYDALQAAVDAYKEQGCSEANGSRLCHGAPVPVPSSVTESAMTALRDAATRWAALQDPDVADAAFCRRRDAAVCGFVSLLRDLYPSSQTLVSGAAVTPPATSTAWQKWQRVLAARWDALVVGMPELLRGVLQVQDGHIKQSLKESFKTFLWHSLPALSIKDMLLLLRTGERPLADILREGLQAWAPDRKDASSNGNVAMSFIREVKYALTGTNEKAMKGEMQAWSKALRRKVLQKEPWGLSADGIHSYITKPDTQPKDVITRAVHIMPGALREVYDKDAQNSDGLSKVAARQWLQRESDEAVAAPRLMALCAVRWAVLSRENEEKTQFEKVFQELLAMLPSAAVANPGTVIVNEDALRKANGALDAGAEQPGGWHDPLRAAAAVAQALAPPPPVPLEGLRTGVAELDSATGAEAKVEAADETTEEKTAEAPVNGGAQRP